MTLKETSPGIYSNDSILSEISDVDGIIFDCDGVLVDVSNSYDLAIQRTTTYVLKEIAGIQKFDPINSKINLAPLFPRLFAAAKERIEA